MVLQVACKNQTASLVDLNASSFLAMDRLFLAVVNFMRKSLNISTSCRNRLEITQSWSWRKLKAELSG